MGATAYLRLGRVQTAGLTATVPLYGYIAGALGVGADPSGALARLDLVITLAAMGVCAHMFGFVHNEIADRAVDERAGTLRRKPLPAGDVTLRGAWVTAGVSLKAGLLIAFGIALIAGPWVFVFASLSAGLAALYNLRGKSFAGGDALLAASVALFVLSGAAAAGGLPAATTTAALGIAVASALILFFNNGFEGGFKDHASDLAGGKRTMVLSIRRRGAKFDSPDGLLVFASLGYHALLLAVAVWFIFGPAAGPTLFENLVRAAVAAGITAGMVRFYVRGIATPDRGQMLALFAAHEMLAVLLLIVMLVPRVSVIAGILLFLAPLVVYAAANKALWGTLAAPDV